MGEGLKRVAKQFGGLTVTARGKTVQFDGDGNCLNPQFIYAVDDYGGYCELVKTEVIKETEKQVRVADTLCVFGCRSRLNKSLVPIYRTPDDAIAGYLGVKRSELLSLERQVMEIRRRIEWAEKFRVDGGQL